MENLIGKNKNKNTFTRTLHIALGHTCINACMHPYLERNEIN